MPRLQHHPSVLFYQLDDVAYLHSYTTIHRSDGALDQGESVHPNVDSFDEKAMAESRPATRPGAAAGIVLPFRRLRRDVCALWRANSTASTTVYLTPLHVRLDRGTHMVPAAAQHLIRVPGFVHEQDQLCLAGVGGGRSNSRSVARAAIIEAAAPDWQRSSGVPSVARPGTALLPPRQYHLEEEVGGSAIEAPKIAGHADLEMTGEYTFVAPERQNERTRRIQQRLAAVAQRSIDEGAATRHPRPDRPQSRPLN